MGGSGGANTWPGYLQTVHMIALCGEEAAEDIYASMGALNLNLAQDIHDAKLYNPFASAEAYDPETILDAVQTRYDTFDTIVSALDEEGDWLSMYTKARTGVVLDFTDNIPAPAALPRVESVNVEDVDVESDVAEFERENLPSLMRSVNRLSGAMLGINAVHSSTYVLGLAKLEGEHLRQANKYRAELKGKGKLNKQTLQAQADMKEREIKSVENREERMITTVNKRISKEIASRENLSAAQLRADAVGKMMAGLTLKVEAGKGAAILQAEIARITGDSYHRQTDADLEISERDALWDIQTYTPMSNLIASISGAPAQAPGLSKGQAIVSGALTGAAAGASIGAAIAGPQGASIGAGVGTVAGAVGGM